MGRGYVSSGSRTPPLAGVRAGAGQGRIYRVYPENREPRKWPNLSSLDAAGLIEQLESPNGWLRDKAQQMIVQHGDRSRVDLLEQMATEGKTPLGRVHALCTLSGLDALKPSVVVRALRDPNSKVRRQAVLVAESSSLRTPEVDAALAELVYDRDPVVRFQLGYSL